MPSVNDILKVTQCSEIFDQEICNVFYYAVAVWTGNLTFQQFLEEWATSEYNVRAPLIVDDCRTVRATMDNETTGLEAVEYIHPPGRLGQAPGDPAPPFTALSFRQNRATKATRNGYKRVGGISENVFQNGEFAASPFIAAATTYADFLEGDYTSSQGDIITPVIVGRTASGQLDLTRVNGIASVEVQNQATTQNSRKVKQS